MARPNTEIAIASINASNNEAWLRGFRTRMLPAGETEIVDAIDKRLAELEELKFRAGISSIRVGLRLPERVQESVRVYEAFLAKKHGRNIRAARTNAMIKRWGEKEAVRRTVTNLDMSNGLELLAKYDRLDCSYERIILDFPNEFDETLRAKARANLANLPAALREGSTNSLDGDRG
ncbi:MAG: hypothetical protein WA459_23475 [Stellaceae bacterium]